MEFLEGRPLVVRNARIVTAGRVVRGSVAVEDGRIAEIREGGGRAGVEFDGDYLLPGLVELHTDHLEAHVLPRPDVMWRAGSAVLAYDAQIAAAGITTVFDSFRIGGHEAELREGIGDSVIALAGAVARAAETGLLRAEHRTHLRCEVPAPNAIALLEAFLAERRADLVSLMDHTPGRRQFRDLEKFVLYYGGKSGRPREEVLAHARARQKAGEAEAKANRPHIVAVARAHGATLASHDDTTLDDVREAHADGVAIAEFPTTAQAAEAARALGMRTVMGAPNVVLGGSHSGNAAARDLAEAGALDILSSDYVPSALLMAAFRLSDVPALGLPGAIRMVTRTPAEATGLTDRGEIREGLRADLLRVALHDGEPVVRAVWREGRRVA